jgi:leucine dehydrogenase
MSIYASDSFADHEQVVMFKHVPSGLRAIVAIHSTALGPALGGCRMWPYENEDSAIEDVLRLSKGMSYKNALAGIPFGGGKSVIIGDSRSDKSEALLAAFAARLNWLGGRYITAEDMGISEKDMDFMAALTPHVAGLSQASGNPSPKTAQGVFLGLKAAVAFRLGVHDLSGISVAVQGLGSVGFELCRLLRNEGAVVHATDISFARVQQAVTALGVIAVAPEDILGAEIDVFAPCAMGAIINDQSIGRLRAKVIAGAANNQLLADRHGRVLQGLNILYAPDYVINAGGVINIAAEVLCQTQTDYAQTKIAQIPATLTAIFAEAQKTAQATSQVANDMAEKILNAQRVPEAA